MTLFRFPIFLILLLGSLPVIASKEFTTTRLYKAKEGRYAAIIEYPVSGSAVAVAGIRRWIDDVLELDDSSLALRDDDANVRLQRSREQYVEACETGKRTVEIVRSYEDEDCVTFESTVTDVDSVTWRTCDCATFSKVDGHRLTVGEIFNCSERQIKILMWQWRDDLQLEVASPDDLVVGHVGFTDGWIVVIGPASHYTGAPFRIRYQAAEPYLKGRRTGGYYANGRRG